MSIEEYDKLLSKQEGKCAICSGTEPTGRRFAVDHDHQTGMVRGLLCTRCNNALGCLQDDPELLDRAAQYIRESLVGTTPPKE